MSQTILSRFCYLQRLLGRAPPEDKLNTQKSQRNVGPAFRIKDFIYKLLLKYFETHDDPRTDYRKPPYPEGANVLGPSVHEILGLEAQYGSRYSKKKLNNIVKVEVKGRVSWAKVLHILKLDDADDLAVQVQGFLEVENEKMRGSFKALGLLRVVEDTRGEFIPGGAIIRSAPYRLLPAWSMGSIGPSILIIDIDVGGVPAVPSYMRYMDETYRNLAGQVIEDDAMDVDTDPSMR